MLRIGRGETNAAEMAAFMKAMYRMRPISVPRLTGFPRRRRLLNEPRRAGHRDTIDIVAQAATAGHSTSSTLASASWQGIRLPGANATQHWCEMRCHPARPMCWPAGASGDRQRRAEAAAGADRISLCAPACSIRPCATPDGAPEM
jgi:hypothetical protein